jgi:hypothetical protein
VAGGEDRDEYPGGYWASSLCGPEPGGANQSPWDRRCLSNDTSPEAEQIQLELLRRATPQERLALALSLSDRVIWLARRAIRRTMPEASEQEVRLKFVAVHYGQDLADRVREHLIQRGRWNNSTS